MKKTKKKKSVAYKLFTVIGAILCVILLPMFICNAVLVIKGSLHPENVPKIFGVAPMIVVSGSMENDEMEPNIRTGDLIFVKNVDTDKLQAGDIIAFMEDDHIVSHRITRLVTYETGETVFYTKGDNPMNIEDKDPVKAEDIVGIYSFKMSKLGNMAMFLQKPLGMALFIGIPIIIFILYDLMRYAFVSKKTNKKAAELEEEVERLRKAVGSDKQEKDPAEKM